MKMTCAMTLTVMFVMLGAVRSANARPLFAIDMRGVIVFNGIGAPPLGTVAAGETVLMSFEVDSSVFVDSIPGDVRGYDIIPGSFSLAFSGGVVQGLAGGPAYFGLVDGFPVSDGFFVSASAFGPGGVPLAQNPYQAGFNVGYVGSTLSSLNIADAVGTYDFTGLTNFGFTLWAFSPDNVVMEMNFVDMTISEVPAPATILVFAPLALGIGRRRRG